MLDPILCKVFEKLADKLFGEAIRRALDNGKLGQRLDQIAKSVESIEDKIDEQRTAPLYAAFIHLRAGEFEKARDKFVDAISEDPRFSAVARYWHAIVLSLINKRDLALIEYIDALTRNPFLAELPYASMADELASLAGSIQQEPWSLRLDNAFLNQHRLAFKGGPAIKQASCSGSSLIVNWREADPSKLIGTSPDFLAAFDLKTGKYQWSQKNSGELQFATPRFVVIKTNAKSDQYLLLDADDGHLLTRMSSTYYSVVFCPFNESDLKGLESFRRANIRMATFESIMDAFHADANQRGIMADAWKQFLHGPPKIGDAQICESPLFGVFQRIHIVNNWEWPGDSVYGLHANVTCEPHLAMEVTHVRSLAYKYPPPIT